MGLMSHNCNIRMTWLAFCINCTTPWTWWRHQNGNIFRLTAPLCGVGGVGLVWGWGGWGGLGMRGGGVGGGGWGWVGGGGWGWVGVGGGGWGWGWGWGGGGVGVGGWLAVVSLYSFSHSSEMQKQSRAYYREFRKDTPDKFRLRQNGRHFGDDTFKRIMLKEMVCHLCIKNH